MHESKHLNAVKVSVRPFVQYVGTLAFASFEVLVEASLLLERHFLSLEIQQRYCHCLGIDVLRFSHEARKVAHAPVEGGEGLGSIVPCGREEARQAAPTESDHPDLSGVCI